MTEQQILREALKAFPIRAGVEVLVCPECNKTRERTVEINALNSWAFKDGISVTINGRGCCF